MKLDEIEKIIRMFENSNITSLNIEDKDLKIGLTKSDSQMGKMVSSAIENKSTAEIIAENGDNIIKSPLVGTYHKAPYVDAKSFVEVGSIVKKGDKLCIIEAMKVMNEIVAPQNGIIKKILCNEGDVVEYDKPLFVIGDSNV